ncbi:MAG: type VI secretion system tube protein TssD [Patiriisocius sp.]|uniref:type VI secretion system tube protein TssD n=1 Tax=Patiriisocius sp. TaxID=2822396 RepID=UPI003EF7C562
MSFVAKFTFEDNTYNVLECSYRFFQKIDYSGRPIEVTRSGLIKLTIESTNIDDIIAWMVSFNDFRTGEIVFLKRDAAAASKKVTFLDGVCVEYEEFFNAQNEVPMKIELSISARQIEVGAISLLNPW